jgi:UvrD-like helicase family protein
MAEYYFNFPPITELTLPQQGALNELNPIALSGGPGTGKSFVSLWRHITNHKRENPVQSQLLTYTTSLAYYLKQQSLIESRRDNIVCQEEIENNDEGYCPNECIRICAGKCVDSTQNWYFNNAVARDEIIVDEAQDMPLDFYKNPNKLIRLTSKISYGADDRQILISNAKNADGSYNINVCSPENELLRITRNRRYPLDKNFRNTRKILRCAKHAFSQAVISQREIISCISEGDFPSLLVTNGNRMLQNETIKDIIRQFNADEHNIGILTPLANLPWAGGEFLTARYYYNILHEEFDCSYYDYTQHDGHGLNSMKNIHITPFKSAKGLEFDTVIIPGFNHYTFNFNVLSWRDFFVGVTRAKSNLFLFSENDIPTLSNVIDKQILSAQDDSPNNNLETNDLPF